LEIIKEWFEPQKYKVTKEEGIETDLTESHRGCTDFIAEKCGETLRIEIEHCSSKEQVGTNIRKNLEHLDILYMIASDDTVKRKVNSSCFKANVQINEKQRKGLIKSVISMS
jgi:hypothetical protein